jgi:hypothetical protein
VNTNKSTNEEAMPLDKIPMGEPDNTPTYVKAWRRIKTIWSYGPASLKVIDIVARIAVAAALYLKLNEEVLNLGAAFLAVTALYEIGGALLFAYGPKNSK